MRIKVKCNIFICNANNICVPSLKENRSVTVPKNECGKNNKKESSVTKRKISKDDAEHRSHLSKSSWNGDCASVSAIFFSA